MAQSFRAYRKQVIRSIKYPILIAFIELFIRVLPLFPRAFLLSTFGALGKAAFYVVRGEAKKCVRHLTKAYPDKPTSDIRQMARMVFVHQAWNFVDYVYTLRKENRQDFEPYWQIEGEEHLRAAHAQNKGVICLAAHLGSWEFSAIGPSVLGYSTTAVSAALKNPRINELIIKYRSARGLKNISRGGVYPQLIQALNNGDGLIIMIDQDTKVPSTFTPFYGHLAYTPIGAARLALETEAIVVPMHFYRKENHQHVFKIGPKIPTIRTSNFDDDLVTNTTNYSKVIEHNIQQNPTQWVWMHERWHTRPETADPRFTYPKD